MPDDNNIKVVARFRPLNKLEIAEGGKEVINATNETCEIALNAEGQTGSHSFTFDRVFASNSRQTDVYAFVGKPVVADVFKGYNGTLFVYGQTGSGKTHTMMGPDSNDEIMKGIIPRCVDQIFVNVENSDPDIEFSIKVSYVEIYMEKIRDLFNPTKVNLQLHEDFKGGKGVFIAGATEEHVSDPEEIFELMSAGAANRAVASTRMNADSSRSHAIFSITVTQKHSVKLDQKSGKLYLVDLAGSEKVGKTKAEGQQLEEAKLINKSLSSLGGVINALTDKRISHVPYRDSKLTRLLQDSLGGNSRTSLIICGSMSEYNQFETLSTLRFGQRAKSITNKAKINRELTVGEYKILLAKMEKEMAELRASKGLPAVSSDVLSTADTAKLEAELKEEREALESQKIDLENEVTELQEVDKVKQSMIEHYKGQVALYQEESESWDLRFQELSEKFEQVQIAATREKEQNASRQALLAKSSTAFDDASKEIVTLGIALKKIQTHVETHGGEVGDLDEDQERQVAAWRREKQELRQEEEMFRKELLAKIAEFARIDCALVDSNRELQKKLEQQRPDFLSQLTSDNDEMPETEEGKVEEILRLRKLVKAASDTNTVPKAALDDAKSEISEKEKQLARKTIEMERHVTETKELRNSLLKDLQNKCEKVIDLDMALSEQRQEHQRLMSASSKQKLRKQLQRLEEQYDQQAADRARLESEVNMYRLDFKLLEKRLAIKNERIDNLRNGIDGHKSKLKEEKEKLKNECARIREELHYWKDKYLRSAESFTTSKVRNVVKVIKGGYKHQHAHLLAEDNDK
eukprot:TRINITY_DN11890_c0_g1_i1.p1 TRINITY_DN11890_c0_g1~~TRINITY_DN11890_c0_g1_i1.p1  ORF type:complete len:807 (+),score=187.98 TRINITY_DN11890_c0_g1_i1:53-2473(+)